MERSVETKEIVFPDLLWWIVYAEGDVAAISTVVGTQPNVIGFDKANLYIRLFMSLRDAMIVTVLTIYYFHTTHQICPDYKI